MEPVNTHLLKRMSYIFTACVTFLGILVYLGWIFDIDILKRVVATQVAMNPVTAICFILSSLSLYMLMDSDKHGWRRRAGYIFAYLVLLVGISKLSSIMLNVDTTIDSWIYQEKIDADIIANTRNRMAPNTATGFVLTSLALLLLHYKTQKKEVPSHFFVIMTGILGMLSLLGYFYQVKAFYGFLSYIPMAIHTAIGFLLMSLAILFAYPEQGIMAEFTRTQVGAITARRLIPAALIVPVILGFMALYLEQHQFVSNELGVAILVLCSIIIFLILIWFNIRELNINDDLRREAEERLSAANLEIRELNNVLEYKVADRTNELKNEVLQKVKLLNDKDIMLKEIHHRVKNNLQVISSLLSLQSEREEDPRIIDVLRKSMARVRTMSLVHEMVYKNENLSFISIKEYINTFVSYLHDSYQNKPTNIQINTQIDEIFLEIDMAIPLCLIINELLSNSFKHAFPNQQTGIINIALKKQENGIIMLLSDNGVGLPNDFDVEHTTSLGMRLIYSLTKQLNGKMKLLRDRETTFALSFLL